MYILERQKGRIMRKQINSRQLLIVSILVAGAIGSQRDIAIAQQMPYTVPAQSLSKLTASPGGLSPLTATANGHSIHIFPTMQQHAARAARFSDPGPLLYHSGGVIMPSASLYAIFWLPASGKLQNGQATIMGSLYPYFQELFLQDYAGHGIGNITTQYYQTIGSTTTFTSNEGGLAGVAFDTSPYPASGCTDAATPGNCLTDAQIRAEIMKVMKANGWTGGLDKIYLLYTSTGEGSCFDSSSTMCAYTSYCGYHSFVPNVSPNIIYANIPYGNLNVCQVPGTPSPNGHPVTEAAISIVSHEITEAITDPLLNAWFTLQGNEIGDLCPFNYGPNGWDGGNANQWWNGHFYELQMEFDNHSSACQQVGPHEP
jgi:hypothetical protein